MLHAQCDQCLTKVERIFPDEERKQGIGMATLLSVITLLLCYSCSN